MQPGKVFVHNRIGLLTAMNCGSSTGAVSRTDEAFARKSLSPATDSEDDKGYHTWQAAEGSGPNSGPSSPTRSGRRSPDVVFLPPPSEPNVVKRSRGKRSGLISTVPSAQQAECAVLATCESLDSADERRFSHGSNRDRKCCDRALSDCPCPHKRGVAIDSEEAGCAMCLASLYFENLSVLDERVLSGDRLSQMTRTYHDIEAVTELLEEKERDLELAARIGQSLLQKNKEFASRNEHLEEQLAEALDEVSQLRHEISLKEDLLHTYADDEAESSGAPSPVKELRNFGRAGMINHIEYLQAKIRKLEEDNTQLKLEQFKYQSESDVLESQERQIVSDAFKEINILREELKEARENNHVLDEELTHRSDDGVRQQEEITRLLTQVVDMQRKQKQVALENEELQLHLAAANNTQYELTKEIQILDDRYQEVVNILDETKEEARLLREEPERYGRSVPFSDSLAAELEGCGGVLGPDFRLRDVPPLGFGNESSIDWPSPMQSTAAGETIGDDRSGVLNAPIGRKEIMDSVVKSEPRPRSTDTHSHRVLSTARFVNNIKNYSMNSRFQSTIPRKQDRPIATPLPIPTLNRSLSYCNRPSPDSAPSSGRCMSSTPRDKRRMLDPSPTFLSPSFKHAAPAKLGSVTKSTSFFENSIVPRFRNRVAPNPLPSSVCRLTHSTSAPLTGERSAASRREGRTWHGATEAFSDSVGLATPCLGRPGIPGTEDLERAIRKLALRRESARYMEMEKRFLNVDGTSHGSIPSGGCTPPPSCPGSPKFSRKQRYVSRSSFTPKLRIVKPLEGSVTLNQWKNLAERDRTLPVLEQTQSHNLSSGIITRDRFAEALSRSREESLNSFHIVPTPEKPLFDDNLKIPEASTVSVLHPQPTSSTSTPLVAEKAKRSDVELSSLFNVDTSSLPLVGKMSLPSEEKENVGMSAIQPRNRFALTSTLYTLTNSRVMNPTDHSRSKPSRVERAHSTVHCDTTFTTAARPAKSCPGVYATAKDAQVCPNVCEQSRPADEVKRTPLEETFFDENTRTCSTQLDMARLFQEYSVDCFRPEEGTDIDKPAESLRHDRERDSDLDSPSMICNGGAPAFTLPASRSNNGSDSSGRSHILWSRSLQRTFLLPSSVPSKRFVLNLNRKSRSRNPETPPNSPITSVPSSSSFLLNEILAETTQSEIVEEKKEDSTFSSNLLSKLSQIGLMGLRGFRNTKTSTTASTSTPAVTTRPVHRPFKRAPASHAMAPPPSIVKCATAPGSLLLVADVTSEGCSELFMRQSSDEKRPQPGSLPTPGDLGIVMKPQTQADWAELHGSSGAINFDVDKKKVAQVDDGYLDEADGSSCDLKKRGASDCATNGLNAPRSAGSRASTRASGVDRSASRGVDAKSTSTRSKTRGSGLDKNSGLDTNRKSKSTRPKTRPDKKR